LLVTTRSGWRYPEGDLSDRVEQAETSIRACSTFANIWNGGVTGTSGDLVSVILGQGTSDQLFAWSRPTNE
jgi:hypothetical protein